MKRFSEAQFKALGCASRGNAFSGRGSNAGGAFRRMVERLITEGLITDEFPRVLTLAGLRAYVTECERRATAQASVVFHDRAATARAALAIREAAEQVSA